MPRKTKFPPDAIVRATRGFACEEGFVAKGQRLRASHPIVRNHPTQFVDGDTLDSELANVWDEVPAPPEHRPHITVPVGIAPERQVESVVDVFQPMSWAPDSPGSKRGGPAPFGSAIRRGQLLDISDPRVKAAPQNFVFPRREVRLEDIERFERLAELEGQVRL